MRCKMLVVVSACLLLVSCVIHKNNSIGYIIDRGERRIDTFHVARIDQALGRLYKPSNIVLICRQLYSKYVKSTNYKNVIDVCDVELINDTVWRVQLYKELDSKNKYDNLYGNGWTIYVRKSDGQILNHQLCK